MRGASLYMIYTSASATRLKRICLALNKRLSVVNLYFICSLNSSTLHGLLKLMPQENHLLLPLMEDNQREILIPIGRL